MSVSKSVYDLWRTIDMDFLVKVDNLHCPSYWNALIKLYVKTCDDSKKDQYSQEKCFLMIMMRSLMCFPEFLQGEDSSNNKFLISARDFLGAYLLEVYEREDGMKLINDLLRGFVSYLPSWPVEYLNEPTDFLRALAVVLFDRDLSMSDSLSCTFFYCQQIARMHELYANICLASPRSAFLMAEQFPLFPNQSKYSGRSLETTPFLLHFFTYQTVNTPTMGTRPILMYPYVPEDQQEGVIANQRDSFNCVHAAQVDILRTFLAASPVSRDYVLNLIAMLCEANRSRRVNPNDFLSSDGLMMNITTSLLVILQSLLDDRPSHVTTKNLFSYFFSDLCRVDIIQRNLPEDSTLFYTLTSIINWLRPTNHLSRCQDPTLWWQVLRAQVDELSGLLENVDSKPSSSFLSFVHDLRHLSDFVALSPSILAAKPFYDYSFNFHVTGRHISLITPMRDASLICSQCGKTIQSDHCYRCICCSHRILCEPCYTNESREVEKAFSPPFAASVLELMASIDEVGRVDSEHNPLTHFYTEWKTVDILGSYDSPFHQTPSFPPLFPAALEKGEEEFHALKESNEEAYLSRLNEEIERIRGMPTDANYIWINGEKDPNLRKYKKTVCFCSLGQCELHGPLTRHLRSLRTHPCPSYQGFVQGSSQCFVCKSSPIIGVVCHCIHCSLQLCFSCYQEEMAIGSGLPTHQCNHVFVLLTHPVSPACFLRHNRNDMRFIPNGTQLLENASAMSDCVLDQFVPNSSYRGCNEGHLQTELLALVVKCMEVSVVGLLQHYQFVDKTSHLGMWSRLRTVQLAVGCVPGLMAQFAEHMAFALLSLVTLTTPSNYPLPQEFHLKSETSSFVYVPSSEIPMAGRNSYSLLRETVVLNVTKCPFFDLVSITLLEQVVMILEWCARTMKPYELQDLVDGGKLDYSLLLCSLCLNSTLINNITTRFDILSMFYCFGGMSRDKDAYSFLFSYPVIRHMVWIFSQQAYIDSSSFCDPMRARTIQLQTVKLITFLLRCKYGRDPGLQELTQLYQPLQIPAELGSHFFQELIHVSSNTHDTLDDLQSQLVACEEQMQSGDDSLRQQHSALKTLTCTYLENIKQVINLLSRSVKYSSLYDLLSSGFLLKRVVRFLLLMVSSLHKPIYLNNPACQTIRLDFDRWLLIILSILEYLVRSFKPTTSSSSSSFLPSVMTALDPDPSYNNLVIVSIIEDDFFSVELMDWSVEYIMQHKPQKDRDRCERWSQAVKDIHRYYEHYQMLEKIIDDDVPDEFLDPVMFTIMQDPVILPSKIRCDRSTVVQQFETKARDPYTREPLSMDMIKPDVELKNRIRIYLKEKLEEQLHKQ